MKFEIKESSPCVKALEITAEAEETAESYKKVFGEFMRHAVVPGFRKGKVPPALLRQKFAEEITGECKQECLSRFYPQAVKDSKLKVLGLQGATEVQFSEQTGFKATVLVEVQPEFDLPKYKKLSIKAGDVTVTDAQVGDRVESFRNAFAKYDDAADDNVVATGDFVCIDYKGALKGKPLTEIVPDQKAVCEATGFWVQVEEGRFLPEILEALKGMKKGETKEKIKVAFPKDAAPEPLKGKKVEYTVTLTNFRVRRLPDDEQFLKDAKFETMDALKAKFRADMEKDAAAGELENRRNQAVELLLKKADFDVPPSYVREQTEGYINELYQRAQYSGINADYFKNNSEKILADADAAAKKRVRLSYILLGIAEAEKLEAADADIDAELAKMAEGSGKSVDELRKQIVENNRLEAFKEHILSQKALDFVLAEAK